MNIKDDKKKNTTNINWFPGHMAKALRDIEANLNKVDMVIELRDARIPMSSYNPLLEKITKNKPRLIILTKKDKADPEETKKWIDFLNSETTNVLAINNFKDNVKDKIVAESKILMKPMIDRMVKRGIKPRAIRAMVLGIPNVGKSTLINQLVKKKVAEVQDKPGVTKALKWINLNNDLQLLDTPGVLWPKFEDQNIAFKIAVIGSINDLILPLDEVCYYALQTMIDHYPFVIKEKLGIDDYKDVYDIFTQYCHKRNWLKKDLDIDQNKATNMFLNELRDCQYGRLTLEYVDDFRK